MKNLYLCYALLRKINKNNTVNCVTCARLVASVSKEAAKGFFYNTVLDDKKYEGFEKWTEIYEVPKDWVMKELELCEMPELKIGY